MGVLQIMELTMDKIPSGFHGDIFLRSLVAKLMPQCTLYIETGTHVGHTFAPMAKLYRETLCLGCEPAKGRHEIVSKRVSTCDNATVFNESSQRFMLRLEKSYKEKMKDAKALLWIDAHSKQHAWPLAEEVPFFINNIKSTYMFIDDFYVPGTTRRQFRFNKFGKQRYTFDFVRRTIPKKTKYNVYYPAYKHPKGKQLTGWVLIQTGPRKIDLAKKYPKLVRLAEQH